MKKKLLTLGALVSLISVNAQVVYVGDGAKFFVSKKALTYSGGNWMVDSKVSKTVENNGQITIVGDYVKGGKVTDAAQDGKEFVNVYNGVNDYGQVKLLSTTGNSTGRLTVEWPKASANYNGASFALSVPFQDQVNFIMNSFGLAINDFKGECAENTVCTDRYKMTLTKWNNAKIHHDAVPTANKFKAGDYYNLNLREPNMQTAMAAKEIVPYKGMPDGRAYSQTAQPTIAGLEAKDFNELNYNQWKTKTNPYNEKYESYMGYISNTSKTFKKNIFRFGNPYTSNLDLSAFDGGNAWLKILNTGELTLKGAYDASLIKDFYVEKRMKDYDYTWGSTLGSTDATNSNYYRAYFDGTQWRGSAEALLIRPTETFNLQFPSLNVGKLGSRMLKVQVDFKDVHKTFDYIPAGTNSNSLLAMASFDLLGNGANMMMAKDVTYNNIQVSNFYQLEIMLQKNKTIQSSPAYIVGTNYYKESGANSNTSEKVFVYGLKDGKVAYNSKKELNEFNVYNSVGKPLGIGFNNLEKGSVYQLTFNLYEDSIFNRVNSLSNGMFYLKDNVTNKLTLIKVNEPIDFVADDKVENRFEVYWKKAPEVIVKEEKAVVEMPKVAERQTSTVVYQEGKLNRIKFEDIAKTAKVEVFSIAGRLISSRDGISTGSDYTLNLEAEGVYMLRVVYANGIVRNLKVVNN